MKFFFPEMEMLFLAIFYTLSLTTIIQKSHGLECNLVNMPKKVTEETQEIQNGHQIQLCRNRNLHLMNSTWFYWDACVQCYSFMPFEFFNKQLCYRMDDLGALWSLGNISMSPQFQRYFYGNEQDRTKMAATFNEQRGVQLWNQCCERAKQCCQQILIAENDQSTTNHDELNQCPRQWDGWQCIDSTPNGTTVPVVCPSHIYFYGEPPMDGCPRFGKKECLPNGVWNQWTDYSTCGRSDSLKRKLRVHIGAYAASLASLIPAVCIFYSYKQLRVPRITMHTNFFLSLIANAMAAILFMSIFNLDALDDGSDEQGHIVQHPTGCKLALTVTKYTRTSTYMWMLCEAFYLHKLIVTSFAEEKRLRFYYLTGWVLPSIFVSIYAISRTLWDNEPCWMMTTSHYEWILNAPMLFSLILNTAFLFNIIHGLITKLKAANTNEPSHFRKAAKATLVLVPLFGVHYLTVLYLPHQESCGILALYYYFSAALDGLQGFIVSIFFCYSTSEVRTLLQRTYRRHRLLRDPRGRSFNSRASATQVVTVTEEQFTPNGDKNCFQLQ